MHQNLVRHQPFYLTRLVTESGLIFQYQWWLDWPLRYIHFQSGTRYADTELARYWMPDDISRECYECATRFSTLRRRHHCRVCGQIFCSRCCSQRVPGKYNGTYVVSLGLMLVTVLTLHIQPLKYSKQLWKISTYLFIKIFSSNRSMLAMRSDRSGKYYSHRILA